MTPKTTPAEPAEYTAQMRNGSHVLHAPTLEDAIRLGRIESRVFGAFDVSTPSGAIVWLGDTE